jgi:hypothetical protein
MVLRLSAGRQDTSAKPRLRPSIQACLALARLRPGNCIGQRPLSGLDRKKMLRLSSSDFDPKRTSILLPRKQLGRHCLPQPAILDPP